MLDAEADEADVMNVNMWEMTEKDTKGNDMMEASTKTVKTDTGRTTHKHKLTNAVCISSYLLKYTQSCQHVNVICFFSPQFISVALKICYYDSSSYRCNYNLSS